MKTITHNGSFDEDDDARKRWMRIKDLAGRL